jgi:hypothetical protein
MNLTEVWETPMTNHDIAMPTKKFSQENAEWKEVITNGGKDLCKSPTDLEKFLETKTKRSIFLYYNFSPSSMINCFFTGGKSTMGNVVSFPADWIHRSKGGPPKASSKKKSTPVRISIQWYTIPEKKQSKGALDALEAFILLPWQAIQLNPNLKDLAKAMLMEKWVAFEPYRWFNEELQSEHTALLDSFLHV